MNDIINLVVDLDETPIDASAARERIAAEGLHVDLGRLPDRVLAWIDDVFGGAWSSEALHGTSVLVTRGDEPVAFATVDARGLPYAWLRGVAREAGVGIFGPFGVAPEFRGTAVGPAVLAIALHELRAMGYRRALIAAANQGLVPYYERFTNARVVEQFDRRALVPVSVRTVVLASGSGTNFQAVIDRVSDGLPLKLAALISNRNDAFALQRATNAEIAAIALPWRRSEESRDAYDARLLRAVERYEPELVLLLGWMHLLAPQFIERFAAILNVHPAFLPLDPQSDVVVFPDGSSTPAFRGARAVTDALAAGATWIGASMHHVTSQTDRGDIVVRKPLRVASRESENEVFARLHPVEHRVVEGAIRRWLYERS